MNTTFDSDTPRVPPPAPPQQPVLPPPPHQPQPVLPPPPVVPAALPQRGGDGPTVSQILVGVGALLVVVAVGIFTAVTWSALGAGGQALVLIAATVGAGAATVLLAERGLRASAEAVAVVTAALALATYEGARDLLFTGLDPWLAWAFGCGVVALALTGLGLGARVRAPMIVALFLGQLCVPLVLAGSTPPVLVVALALLWLAVADVLLATATSAKQPEVSALAGAFSAVAWLASVVVGTVLLFESPERAMPALVLAASVAAAVAVSSHQALRGWWVVAAAGATVSTVLAMIGTALALGAGAAFWLPVAVIAGGVAVWLPTRSDDRLVAVTAVAGASAALVASAELARSLAAAAGPYFSDSWARLGWSATAGDVVAPVETTWFMGEGDLTLTFLGLVAATGLLVRWPRVALVAGALTVAAGGALLDLSVVAVVVVEVILAIGFCLGFALDRRIPGEAGLIGLCFAVLTIGWAHVVAPELALGVLIVMLAAAVAAVVAAVEGSTVAASRREGVLIGGVGVAWLTGLGSAFSFGVVMGWDPSTVWLFTAVAAMVGSLAGFVLDDRSSGAAILSDSCAVAAVAVAGLFAAALGDADTLSLLLAAVTVTGIAHTLRPDRFWPASIMAVGAGVSLTWLRLSIADIEVVEAYSLPLAAGVGLLGWVVHRRGHAGGSWAITGPALLVATVPSTLVSLGSPGEARSLLVIAAAVVMIVVGATLKWKAPLVLGAAIATVVGLAELWPAINRLPRWSVLATLGLTLIVLGARIEEGKKGVARLAGRLNSMW